MGQIMIHRLIAVSSDIRFSDQIELLWKAMSRATFQDAVTPIMEGIVDLHNYILFYLIFVLTFVMYVFFAILYNFWFTLKARETWVLWRTVVFRGEFLKEHAKLEIVWTLLPGLILLSFVMPSMMLLYSMDEIISVGLTVTAIGQQWYWIYELGDFKRVSFDAYMIPEDDLARGQKRLLHTDNMLVLPIHVPIRVLTTAGDVLHSWAVPSLGVKADAVPGRLNQIYLYIRKYGIYYGQCSELCGVNHGFMPITIKAVSVSEFKKWVALLRNK